MKKRTVAPSIGQPSLTWLKPARHLFLTGFLLLGFGLLAPAASAQKVTFANVGKELVSVCVFEGGDRVRVFPLGCWNLRANQAATWDRNNKSKFHIALADVNLLLHLCGREDVAGDVERIEVAKKPCTVNIVPKTVVRFCNDNTDRLYVAIAYLTKDKGWISNGWHDVKARECHDVALGYYGGDIYYYAADDGDGRWTGDTEFCVHWTEGFRIANSDKVSCQVSGHRRVAMTKLAIKPGITTQRLVP